VNRRLRIALSFGAAIGCAAALSACGSGVPSGAVAQVGAATITKAQFNHWMLVLNDSNYFTTGTAPVPVPVPPNYATCEAAELAASTSGSVPSQSVLKQTCAARYAQLEPDVVEYLIQGVWVQGEANDLGVHVSHAAVVAGYNTEIKSVGKRFKTFLEESQETTADLQWTELLHLLAAKIDTIIQKGAKKVSPAAIKRFYTKNSAEFHTPERRNLELVLVASAATAAQVKSLLAGGASFASIAKQYSTDPATKNSGGVFDGVEPGEETAAFNTAIFAAPTGQLEGPVKTAFGYYVFEVTGSTAASTETLAAATPAIRTQLQQAAEQAAGTKFGTAFGKKWKARTQCATGFIVAAVCANAPSTGATGSSGSTAAG
jgi:foldase protein PrsA